MFFDDDSQQAQQKRTFDDCKDNHEAKLSHEVISGAAAYEAMKAYEEHCAKEGRPESHARAKEIAAGLAGAMVDRLVESKGLNFIDKMRAKHEAKKMCDQVIVEKETFPE